MSDLMRVQPFAGLLRWILNEYEANESIWSIHRSLFYTPRPDAPYAVEDMFGHALATPIGPAAGPHTQLAQNIVCAWLSGGRFIELKTVQIMDELEIPRPCIDMEDEGYNVEWSQELKLDQSAREYVNAWALLHILHRLLGFEDRLPLGTILNMSVGYNLEGIRSEPMVRFMDRLEDASEEIAGIRAILKAEFPQFAEIEIPSRLTNSITLSTMHGCPPDEIEKIARYLLEERGLHTIVKLNPTLLGQETVMRILYDDLGWHEIDIPDRVFEHDLKYPRAVELIKALKQVATQRGLTFGVKLSNTLAMTNHKRRDSRAGAAALPGDEMYMSGRALYPITMNLFHKLAQEFNGDLNVSYSAGADQGNVTQILAAGARPVTAATDLLKPGGYSRMIRWLAKLEADMRARGAASLQELAADKLDALRVAAADALLDPRYKKQYHPYGLPKVTSGLDLFDCVAAPCVEQCAVLQDVPEYAWLIAHGEYDRALRAILARNPLPGVTGYVCTHLCQTRCTRNNYDEPVAIRALKRFAVEHGTVQIPNPQSNIQNRRVAVIGSGPSGLAAAFFLALSGVQVKILEAKDRPGGMLAIAGHYRLPPSVVEEDIQRITALGVEIELNHPVTTPPEELLKGGFDGVYVACGFQRDAWLDIEGVGTGTEAARRDQGIWGALAFLEQATQGKAHGLGTRVLVIGGGNTAMDVARTAQRLTGHPVTVVYRRTRAEMPADEEEIEGMLEEGSRLEELVSPSRIILRDGHVAALECTRNRLGEPGPDGRRRPVAIAGSEFQIEADSIILAIGQSPDPALFKGSRISVRQDGTVVADPQTGRVWTESTPPGAERASQPVYAGGDVVRGPAIIIEACADGRRAAEAICREFGIPFAPVPAEFDVLSPQQILEVKAVRTVQERQQKQPMLPVSQRTGFELVDLSLSDVAARQEAARCMQCSTFCDKCVEVCPNRANFTYLIQAVSRPLPILACEDDNLVVVGEEAFRVSQGRQIIHVDDFCNECGNCATFCVHQGKPYTEKPRLFLRREAWQTEDDNAFYIAGDAIHRREGGQESSLSVRNGSLVFEDDRVRIQLSPDLLVRRTTCKKPFEGTLSLRGAAEMSILLNGVLDSAPFLIVG